MYCVDTGGIGWGGLGGDSIISADGIVRREGSMGMVAVMAELWMVMDYCSGWVGW